MTVVELMNELIATVEQGYGDAQLIIEEEGEGYFGNLLRVDTLMVDERGATLCLLGAPDGRSEESC